MADSIVKQNLKHQFVQHWSYFLYIYLILNSHCHLPVEAGKYMLEHIKLDEKCNLCEANQNGDEYHCILECNALLSLRKKLFN